MTAGLHHQPRELKIERSVAIDSRLSLARLRLQSGNVLLEVGSEYLLHLRRKLAMPANCENSSILRDILVDYGALWRFDLVDCIDVVLHDLAAGIHSNAVCFYGAGGSAERC